MWKYLPISVELQQQVAYDEGTAPKREMKDITPDQDVFIETPVFEVTEGE